MQNRADGPDYIDGEVLGQGDPGPQPGARTVAEPGWVSRNRDAMQRGREAALTLAMFSPPPVRLAIVGASLAVEGLFTWEDARTGRVEPKAAGLRAAGIALDGLGIAAAARIGPAALIRHGRALAAVRTIVARAERRTP